ncbi:phage holin family protein [Leucobacter sp. cx-42]|uniref:phage holin family protein n=1 Tax=unclassified Leucobacter TaxID=2621730 RepID=UPI00165D5EC7|nr:phage holin family protein [Leucobacter sp. cx-42]
MIRFLLNLVSHVISAAAALLIANWILPQVTVHAAGFVVAVLVFALAQSVLSPFIFNLARQYASAILGGIGLVSTLVALWVATLFPDGLTISGLGWVLAPLVVWIVTALGGWILMGLVFKRTLQKHEQGKKGAA